MEFKKYLASAILATLAVNTNADSYLGASYVASKYSEENQGISLNHSAISLKVGTELNKYIGVEVRAGMGFTHHEVYDVRFELDSVLSAHVKISPFGSEKTLSPYLVAGITRTSMSVSGSTAPVSTPSPAPTPAPANVSRTAQSSSSSNYRSISVSGSDPSFGVGLEVNTKQGGIFVQGEYLRIAVDEDKHSFELFSFTVGKRF